MDHEESTTVTVAFERKKSDGNYGTGTAYVCWAKLPIGASPELIKALAQTTEDGMEAVKRLALDAAKGHVQSQDL